MATAPFRSLTCPLDGAPLQQQDRAWCCPSGHSFDVARQGYVHLLPVQKKRSLEPGDSKAMVAARQRFLNAGHYQSLAKALAGLVLAGHPGDRPMACLDAGCGEGYYLRQLAGTAAPSQPLALAGLDISKWAVQAAARQDKTPQWIVGSNANLPVATESLDGVLCVFGFPVYTEFARVLKPGGRLIRVEAGTGHLRELRETLYPSLKTPRGRNATAPTGFIQGEVRPLQWRLILEDPAAIADLLAMTPHYYRASAEGLSRVASLQRLDLTLDMRLSTLIRQ
ncbi:MAG: methyltransferase domain-containing protein [Oleiphilaceae bacterium]|nr:methyltransferase domain-containing protein [Oleiphilaceae bacterium]